MRYVILRKRAKTKGKVKQQQQQTLIKLKNLSVLKTKLNNKVKIASDKTETKQNKF